MLEATDRSGYGRAKVSSQRRTPRRRGVNSSQTDPFRRVLGSNRGLGGSAATHEELRAAEDKLADATEMLRAAEEDRRALENGKLVHANQQWPRTCHAVAVRIARE